jgi:hypothetical protein
MRPLCGEGRVLAVVDAGTARRSGGEVDSPHPDRSSSDSPDEPGSMVSLGQCHAMLGDYPRAIQLQKQALTILRRSATGGAKP